MNGDDFKMGNGGVMSLTLVAPLRDSLDGAEPVAEPESEPPVETTAGGGQAGAVARGGRGEGRGAGGGEVIEELPPNELPPGCPVIPVGVLRDQSCYLDTLRQLRMLKPTEHGRAGIAHLFGGNTDYLVPYYPRKNKDGDTVGFRPEMVADALMYGAARRGVLDLTNRVRGRGCWLGPGGELVMHAGDGLVRSRPPQQGDTPEPAFAGLSYETPGIHGRYIYPAGSPTPRPADEPAPRDSIEALFRMLCTWRWRRGDTDARLLLGWIAAAILGAALKWRPAAWITGDRGTGKSTLQELIRDLLGDALVQSSDTTAAALWQHLGQDALPVALDEVESESDNRAMQRVIRLARQAASGGLVLRGGQDHTGMQFVARSSFLFSSIIVPSLRPQDRSRLAILELLDLPRDAVMPVISEDALSQAGRALRRRLLDGWPRFQQTLAIYRRELVDLGHGGRGVDQWGTLLACADLALHDRLPDSDSVRDWTEELAHTRLFEVQDETPDWRNCLDFLTTLTLDAFRNGSRQAVGSLIHIAAGGDPSPNDQTPEAANAVLKTYGLKVEKVMEADENGFDRERYYLAVAQKNAALARLFDGTQWQVETGGSAPWVTTLRRCDQARNKKAVRFAGGPARAVLLPVDVVLPEGDDDDRPAASRKTGELGGGDL